MVGLPENDVSGQPSTSPPAPSAVCRGSCVVVMAILAVGCAVWCIAWESVSLHRAVDPSSWREDVNGGRGNRVNVG